MLKLVKNHKIIDIKVHPSYVLISLDDEAEIEVSLSREDYDDYKVIATIGCMHGKMNTDDVLNELSIGDTVENHATGEVSKIESFGDFYEVFVQVETGIRGMNAAVLSKI